MGWVASERLSLAFVDGSVKLYNICGESSSFSLGHEIIGVRYWESGLVALTTKLKFIAVESFADPLPKLLAEPELTEVPRCWTVIPPAKSITRHAEVLFAADSTIVVVDISERQDQLLQDGPFNSVAVSPDGKLVALLAASGTLSFVPSDFSRKIADVRVEGGQEPTSQELCWCGNNAALLPTDTGVSLVTTEGEAVSFDYGMALVPVAEIDSAKVITAAKSEIIARVPGALQQIFAGDEPGSPAAQLWQAYKLYEQRNPRGDEYRRSIKTELPEAVDVCIEAAAHELDVFMQQRLLKAALYGKRFIDFYNADYFVETCKVLRVLNGLANYRIGLPLTYPQFQASTTEALIGRLLNRHMHFLASRLCEVLGVSIAPVVVHWACAKVKYSADDDDTIYRRIQEKLQHYGLSISFQEIALTAHQAGRAKLATDLLEHEPVAANQVMLLMSMNEMELALDKAIQSGDVDLMFYVLISIRRKVPLNEFFRVVNQRPLASNLLVVYARQCDAQLLRDFYYQDDRGLDSALELIEAAYSSKASKEEVLKLVAEADSLANEGKPHSLETQITAEYRSLLDHQGQLEKEPGDEYVGLSLVDTLYRLVLTGQLTKAGKLKSEFRLQDDKYWWVVVRALSEARDWDALSQFAQVKKSPIGYQPFYEQCVKYVQYDEASKYAMKCEPSIRAKLLLEIGKYIEAAECALSLNDLTMFREIRKRCTEADRGRQLDIIYQEYTIRNPP